MTSDTSDICSLLMRMETVYQGAIRNSLIIRTKQKKHRARQNVVSPVLRPKMELSEIENMSWTRAARDGGDLGWYSIIIKN